MIQSVEKLLILQERDCRIGQVEGELANIEPQQQTLRASAAAAQAELDQAKGRLRQIETSRDGLELEVKAKKDLIAKYCLQQFQTRKNEEYRALAHEIETCKAAIFKIEDQEIELMEQGEATQKEIVRATRAVEETGKQVAERLAQLGAREQGLQEELAGLQASRQELAAAVGESARSRYERLVRSKGGKVIVGVEHGVCGGCHMRLPPQLLVECQAEKGIVTCSNCGRIVYYTADMDLAIMD
jgi:predicted  nucleic acid-binding Zn-ribbon protein